MRIGIDTRVLNPNTPTPVAGVSHYVRYLINALKEIDHKNEYVMLSPNRGLPFFSSHILFANKIRKAKLDVFHGPANSLPLTLTLSRKGRGIKRVITVHDLAIYKHPEWFPRGQWFSKKIVVPRSIKKSNHIIVPSESTKRDLMEIFKVDARKISVIPLGVEERFFNSLPITNNYKFTKPYILFVGTLEPRKNLPRLLEAYKSLPEEILANYDLVIAGAKGWGTPTSDPLLNLPLTKGESRGGSKGGEREGVKFLGYVPDDQMPGLYQGASAFVYPSLYEGFGLPVLEAMAAGVPVVTTAAGGAPLEAVASQDKVIVDPYSIEQIREAIVKLIEDNAYTSQISRAGQDRARQFTWQRTALETLRVYKT